MAQRYAFKTEQGSSIIPTTDGDYFTGELSASLSLSEFYIEFYSDSSGLTPVTPTAGSISVYGSPIGNIFLGASGGQLTASEVSTPNGLYTPPLIDGLSVNAKMTLSGISGANFCRAILFKYSG